MNSNNQNKIQTSDGFVGRLEGSKRKAPVLPTAVSIQKRNKTNQLVVSKSKD